MGIHQILSLKCADSTRIVSESLDRKLPATERWAVGFHAFVCRSCRRYKRQLMFLRAVMQAPPPLAVTLSSEARERIRRAVVAARR